MRPQITINGYMFTLLVEKEMDAFTVTEARDMLMSVVNTLPSRNEARKVVYRQLYRLESKGWLTSSGEGRNKRYSQTEEFKTLSLKPCLLTKAGPASMARPNEIEHSVLLKEKCEYEGELEITLSEVEEYQALHKRFPQQSRILMPMLQQAKEHSASLLGKINALSKVLRAIQEHPPKC